LVVWCLDRLGRGPKHLIESIDDLDAREVGFRSLTDAIDTMTPAGRLQLHIFGALRSSSARSSASVPVPVSRANRSAAHWCAPNIWAAEAPNGHWPPRSSGALGRVVGLIESYR
jgi:hypothetical protein